MSQKISFDLSLFDEVVDLDQEKSNQNIGSFEGIFEDSRTKAKIYGLLTTLTLNRGNNGVDKAQRKVLLQK